MPFVPKSSFAPHVTLALAAVAAAASACGEVPSPPPKFDVLATSVDHPPAGVAPTAELSVELSATPDPTTVTEDSMFLVMGAPSRAELDAAKRGMALPSSRGHVVSGRRVVVNRVIRFEPDDPLDPEKPHTLVLGTALRSGSQHLAQPVVRAFVTGAAATGAAVLSLRTPAPGAVDVVRNLRVASVSFSRPVAGVDATSLRLVDEAGQAVPAAVAPRSCAGCYEIQPGIILDSGRRYHVEVGAAIVDERGDAPFHPRTPPGFTVGMRVQAMGPRLDDVTAVTSSGCVVVEWLTDVASSSKLCVDGNCTVVDDLVSQHRVTSPLAQGASGSYVVSSRDESTAPPSESAPEPTPPSSPRQLVITEVLTRPFAGKQSQQFVEVWNHGATAATLAGLELRAEAGGNPLPAVAIPAGGYGLIVPSTFLEDDGVDPRPAAGTVIVRVDKSRLGHNGLHAGGEFIALFEADGRLVSRFTTHGLKLAHGQSAHRVGTCDVAPSFAPTPDGTSTPGRP